MIKSFRLRLTVWYVGFFSLLFVLFTVFLYNVLSNALQSRLDETLASQANTAASLFADELRETRGNAPKAASEVVDNIRPGASRVALLEGSLLLGASAAFTQREIDAIQAGSATNGSRVAIRRLNKDGRSYTAVAVGSLDSIAADLDAVRRALFFAAPLLLALAGIGGYLVATRSLAPLGWMAEQARRISGSNLDTRLEIGNAANELKGLAASFNELLSRIDLSFEGMRRFVADASHELRTPISVIRGEADVALSHSRTPAEYKESLNIILDESRRLSRLVDDLLNLARADAGRVKLQMREFYFNDLLTECCRTLQALANARNIALECRCAGDVSFHGDEELLRRLVVNLLDNAIRYTPPGGTVSASLEADGAGVRIRIADSGVGIPAEAATHVFERFYRADKARSRQDGGFGLGLAIVKWIAESHHGAVGLASEPGEGSTFTVTLPLLQAHSSSVHLPEPIL